MVCEKNKDKVHDFAKDPIELVREGNVLKANGTTLGADNGIGCAMGLALAAPDAGRGEDGLELLDAVTPGSEEGHQALRPWQMSRPHHDDVVCFGVIRHWLREFNVSGCDLQVAG